MSRPQPRIMSMPKSRSKSKIKDKKGQKDMVEDNLRLKVRL